jgi:hypothetical protein
VIAWRKDMERCQSNTVAGNPAEGVKRPAAMRFCYGSEK